MFFPDSLAALREMLRVTRPGGRIALAVWYKSDLNPFINLITVVVARYVPTPPADHDEPGAFRFAERGKLASILTRVGAVDVHERLLIFSLEAPISVEDYWTLRSETSDTLRAKLEKLSAGEVQQIRQEGLEVARDYFPNNQMSFPAQMLIVSAKRGS